MSTSVRIANVVDEICRRQDQVLIELDRLDQQIEQILRTMSPQPELIPIPVQSDRKAA